MEKGHERTLSGLFSDKSHETPRDVVKAYHQTLLNNQEEETVPVYNWELTLLSCVKNGDEKALNDQLDNMSGEVKRIGKMSANPLRQAQYMLVSGITLVTRYAIMGGLSEAEAYSLSDGYLRKMDSCREEDEVMRLFPVALRDFTHRVNKAKTNRIYSAQVTKTIRYISEHLHKRIKLEELASRCNITPEYLSALFKKNTGLSPKQFILREKLKTAAQMLEQSEFTIQEITYLLAFGSQSAFCTYFKRMYGMTPVTYRNKNNSQDFH